MNIQLVQDKYRPSRKWLVWKRNITDKEFVRMIDFKSDDIWNEINTINFHKSHNQPSYNKIDLLSNEVDKSDIGSIRIFGSPICKSDLFRNFTMEEYTLLSIYLLTNGYRYNKKKDEFIKIIK